MSHILYPYGSSFSKTMLFLGGGELGKELVIAAQRLGIYAIVLDNYNNAPAMSVANESYCINMKNGDELKQKILSLEPDYIVPEIEAINIGCLLDLEKKGFEVIPSANAVNITMHRQRLRDLARKLNLKTTKYAFAENIEEYNKKVLEIGLPCVVKPSMSSSGKGQSIVHNKEDVNKAWFYSQENLRGTEKSVIIEQYLDFDCEITLLTIQTANNDIYFCEPIGHEQKDGDFIYSWQPHNISQSSLNTCKEMATKMVQSLQGSGVFGMEFFIKDKEVYFNECSPRPHDTGYLTLKTQNLSEFDLHIRAIMGYPIGNIKLLSNGMSKAINYYNTLQYHVFNPAIVVDNWNDNYDLHFYYFNKPVVDPLKKRRVGLVISLADDLEESKKAIDNLLFS